VAEHERANLPILIGTEFEISISEARRLICQGAVKADGEPLLDLDPPMSMVAGKELSVGKKLRKRVPPQQDGEQ
jgi:ribosomal protein S4